MAATTVAVSTSTRDRIANCKPESVSYDEFLNEVLDMLSADEQEFEMQMVAGQSQG